MKSHEITLCIICLNTCVPFKKMVAGPELEAKRPPGAEEGTTTTQRGNICRRGQQHKVEFPLMKDDSNIIFSAAKHPMRTQKKTIKEKKETFIIILSFFPQLRCYQQTRRHFY